MAETSIEHHTGDSYYDEQVFMAYGDWPEDESAVFSKIIRKVWGKDTRQSFEDKSMSFDNLKLLYSKLSWDVEDVRDYSEGCVSAQPEQIDEMVNTLNGYPISIAPQGTLIDLSYEKCDPHGFEKTLSSIVLLDEGPFPMASCLLDAEKHPEAYDSIVSIIQFTDLCHNPISLDSIALQIVDVNSGESLEKAILKFGNKIYFANLKPDSQYQVFAERSG